MGMAGDHIVELDEGRTLRILGVNSALTCKKKDAKGKLLPRKQTDDASSSDVPGEELIVLTHHPLDWFQDSDEARKYLRKRARIYLSGHEHNPAVKVDPVSLQRTSSRLRRAQLSRLPRKGRLSFATTSFSSRR